MTLEYVSSVGDDSEIMQYDILGSQAHVLMLHRNGILDAADLKKILSALQEIQDEKVEASGAEDVHEMIESMVVERAGWNPVEGCTLPGRETIRSRWTCG